MHERRFPGAPKSLRRPQRVKQLEPERVVDLSLAEIEDAVASVLDVGAGSGLFAGAFAARGLTVAGVDIRPEMVAAAQAHVPAGAFQEAPAEALPYEADAFDLVFMGVVLHEVDDHLTALQEARRVARLRVAILEWPHRRMTVGPPLGHRLKPEQVRALAEEAGFRSVEAIELAHTVLYRLEV